MTKTINFEQLYNIITSFTPGDQFEPSLGFYINNEWLPLTKIHVNTYKDKIILSKMQGDENE